VIVDDCSTDGTADFVEKCAEEFGVADKVRVLRNDERMWEVANVLQAMSWMDDDDVVCRLDLDDYLCDLNALEILAKAYTEIPDLEAAWTSHRWFDDRGVTSQNISGPMPANADPYKHPWVSSHMKTWRKSVSKRVFDANYRGPDDEYIKRAGDQAIYLPVLKLAKRRIYIPVVTYAYRCDMRAETFQTDDARFQKDEAEFLRERGFLDMNEEDVSRRDDLVMRKMLTESLTVAEQSELDILNERLKFLLPKPTPLPDEVLKAIEDARRLP
jgi:glycosyltransferase involved in cell wall biosynthesis